MIELMKLIKSDWTQYPILIAILILLYVFIFGITVLFNTSVEHYWQCKNIYDKNIYDLKNSKDEV